MSDRLESYEAFWPYYVSEHRDPTCRRLHIVGTGLTLVVAVVALFVFPPLLLACLFTGYGFAWVGHFVFEKNRPATFTYPLWSLRADFRMFRLTLLGKMQAEIERAESLYPARAEA